MKVRVMPIFDITSIMSMDPFTAMQFLIVSRLYYTSKLSYADEKKAEQDSLDHPINPLLLASAIGMSMLKKQDYQSFLSHYISGTCLSDLEEKLLILPDFENEEELSKFLHIEADFIQALRLISLASMLPTPQLLEVEYTKVLMKPAFKPFPEKHASIVAWKKLTDCRHIAQYYALHRHVDVGEISEFSGNLDESSELPRIILFLIECWESLKKLELPENWIFDRFLVLYYAWVLINPVFLTMGLGGEPSITLVEMYNSVLRSQRVEMIYLPQMLLFARLHAYGNAMNNSIHNAREHYEYQLNVVKADYNALLRNPLTKEAKKVTLMRMKQRLSNAQMLIRRGFRLYEWSPSELSANQATEMMYRKHVQSMKDHKSTTEQTDIRENEQDSFPLYSVTYGE